MEIKGIRDILNYANQLPPATRQLGWISAIKKTLETITSLDNFAIMNMEDLTWNQCQNVKQIRYTDRFLLQSRNGSLGHQFGIRCRRMSLSDKRNERYVVELDPRGVDWRRTGASEAAQLSAPAFIHSHVPRRPSFKQPDFNAACALSYGEKSLVQSMLSHFRMLAWRRKHEEKSLRYNEFVVLKTHYH
ncbi:unnamed protein product [Leptosia nina]|uniref:Uncharacterized protein n=1 Tax=Leptosia nina TaxID=320188 RepID=A0AAV1J5L0_9NEOP